MEKGEGKTSKKAALFVTTMSAFVTSLSLSSVNVALPSIGKTFSLNAVYMNWIMLTYTLATSIFLVPIGKIADIYGRKKVFLAGTGIFTGACLLMGFSINPEMLIILRVVQGIGSASLFGIGVAILSSVYPPGERGKNIGITVTGVYSGLSLGPFVGGLITHHIGWRGVFFMNVPFGIAMLIVILLKLKGEWLDARGEKFDLIGSIIYCLTLLFIIYGASHLPSLFSIAIIIIGIIGIFIFVYHEMRVKNPVLNIALFKNNRPFVFSNVAALIHYSASFATGFLLSFYLQFIKGFSAQSAGFVLVCQPIMMALISPLAGKASDRIEARIVASSGMALTGIGLIMLVFLKADTDLIYIITSQIIIGSGFGLFSSPNTNAVMASVGGKFYGVASSLISTMRLLGQVFNLSIVMLVFNLVIGKVGIGPSNLPQLLQAIKISFAISGGLCSIGVYTSLSRGKIGHTN